MEFLIKTYLIRASPILPLHSPLTHSSVLNNYKFKYASNATRIPLYSMPHLSLTMTGLSIRSIKKGYGLIGMGWTVAEVAFCCGATNGFAVSIINLLNYKYLVKNLK